MNKKILKFQIFSFIFTAILGTLLHFIYNWSSNNLFVAFFSAVNESVWEHLKLLFFPMLLTTIIGYFYISKETSNFLCAKTIGIITSLLFIIIFFYTYTSILGTNIGIIDISSFFIAIILGEFLAFKIMVSNMHCNHNFSIIILIILLLSFVIFTYNAPKIELFRDYVSNSYGVFKEV